MKNNCQSNNNLKKALKNIKVFLKLISIFILINLPLHTSTVKSKNTRKCVKKINVQSSADKKSSKPIELNHPYCKKNIVI